jgi:dihydropteroate synthase
MIKEGVDIIDVGGESTRPGSEPVGLKEEISRVIPVVEEIKKRFYVAVSVDTYKSSVAKAALDCGADIINDISAMNFDENMASILSKSNCGVVAMHIKGEPKNMQKNPKYKHLIHEINEYFSKVLNKSQEFGIDKERIVLDPGIGFGKSFEDNYKILNNIKSFMVVGRPILIGLSKKSFIGYTLNEQKTDNRLFGTIGANVAAFLRGASIFRVHNVKENADALKLAASIRKESLYT